MTPEELANSATKIIEETQYTNLLQSMVDYVINDKYQGMSLREKLISKLWIENDYTKEVSKLIDMKKIEIERKITQEQQIE